MNKKTTSFAFPICLSHGAPLLFVLPLIGVALASDDAHAQTTWYVDDGNCPGPGTGTVADPFCKIQDGIGASTNGDEIIVAPGAYNELINFIGKGVTLRSSGGRDVTIIDAGPVADPGTGKPVVRCASGEGPDTVLDGFTVTGGTGDSDFVDPSRLIGGGMFINNSSPTVTNCGFSGNIVSGGAGGMFVNNGSPTVTNCIFSANVANGIDGGGGVLNNGAGNMTLIDCTFIDNVATITNGGGLINVNAGVATVTGCTFLRNVAGADGGGMYNNNSGPIVTGCSFTENEAPNGGGGGMFSFVGSSPIVTDCVFTRNVAVNGGGWLNDQGSPTVVDCTFMGNAATEGGGMMINRSDTSVDNCSFSGNSAEGDGGATGNGGAIRNSQSNPSITGCTFSQNTATNAGGGMRNDSNSNPTIADCTFSENTSVGAGGGMESNGSSPTVIGCAFRENSASGGGGMYNIGNAAIVTNCMFAGNSAFNGGGMLNDVGSHASVTNSVFSGNMQVAVGGGGGLTNNAGGATLRNCTFSSNTAESVGGGIDNASNSSMTLFNCIVWGNLANVSGNQITNPNSSATISFSDIQGSVIGGNWNSTLGTDAGGNIDANPLFMDAIGEDNTPGTEDDDLRLSFGSPCLDAGNNDAVPLDALDLDDDGNTGEPIPFDLDGNARFVDDPYTDDCTQPDVECGTPPVVDMGAYEFPCEEDLPQVVHAAGQPGETRPFTGYVDSLAESTNGEFVDLGLDEVVFVFNVSVRAIGGGELDADSFLVTSTGGDPPTIDTVDDSQNPTIRVTLATLPPLQEWTTVVALVENLCGDPIESVGDLGPGVEEPDRVDFLFLPADVDQNGEVGPFDLLRFRQIANNIIVPTHGILEDYVDTNRTGEITPFDLLLYRQLINGTIPATRAWNGEAANHPQP